LQFGIHGFRFGQSAAITSIFIVKGYQKLDNWEYNKNDHLIGNQAVRKGKNQSGGFRK
jgi:hypothetical protein